ncbi:MAG: transcriptional regulator [Terracidiphilus sp.]
MVAQPIWTAVGPAGGDARAIAAVPGQPRHLYLGATNSWLYESLDGGASWHRLSKLDSSDDLILDHIIVDRANPTTVFVAAWRLDHPGGGLWVSRNAGRSWSVVAGLRGQSIRALAQAPSAPKVLVAGTLEGVYRSSDGGSSWSLISPPGSKEIHEVESLAIDPNDPAVIYAGTWHLPWKTSDGGTSWHNIKKGVIDDSDVFSIIVDPERPKIVFASACSGIYKSENAAELFKRIQGIPSTARRTRVLKQDPANRDIVYAGTTEGLYKTLNGGKSFQRMTGPEVIVNDVFVDPEDSNHVIVAADRGGVLTSHDAATTFVPSNDGFSERRVEALLVDSHSQAGSAPARIFAGVVNDKSFGGVFVSGDGGASWQQTSDGLEGRDVFALAESPEGTILAGTNRGIFALDQDAQTAPAASWSPRNTIQNILAKPAIETHLGTRVNVEKRVKDKTREISGRVFALDLSGDAWLASTVGGLFTSSDKGASWQGGPVIGSVSYLSVAAHGALLAAVRQDGAVLSKDAGQSWTPIGIPAMLTRIHSVAFSADGALWLGSREGVYFTRDLGHTWLWVNRFPLNDVDDLTYDTAQGRILVSSQSSDQVYAIDAKSLTWTWAQTGYRINRLRAYAGKLLAASLFDGVLIEPQAAVAVKRQK